MIGLERGKVRLCPHITEWDTEAAQTISELKELLGDASLDIQHVGSTSIPTIMAKPIIDIAVAADSFPEILELEALLLSRGYYYRPSASTDGQLLFAKGSFYDGTGKLQTHFIHVVPKDSEEWKNYLLFRDYLRNFPDVAERYEALKLSLARSVSEENAREEYVSGKADFITKTIKEARDFFKNT